MDEFRLRPRVSLLSSFSLHTLYFAAQHTSILPPCSITESFLNLFSLIFWQLARQFVWIKPLGLFYFVVQLGGISNRLTEENDFNLLRFFKAPGPGTVRIFSISSPASSRNSRRNAILRLLTRFNVAARYSPTCTRPKAVFE